LLRGSQAAVSTAAEHAPLCCLRESLRGGNFRRPRRGLLDQRLDRGDQRLVVRLLPDLRLHLTVGSAADGPGHVRQEVEARVARSYRCSRRANLCAIMSSVRLEISR
jgi:hypothetical protein